MDFWGIEKTASPMKTRLLWVWFILASYYCMNCFSSLNTCTSRPRTPEVNWSQGKSVNEKKGRCENPSLDTWNPSSWYLVAIMSIISGQKLNFIFLIWAHMHWERWTTSVLFRKMAKWVFVLWRWQFGFFLCFTVLSWRYVSGKWQLQSSIFQWRDFSVTFVTFCWWVLRQQKRAFQL